MKTFLTHIFTGPDNTTWDGVRIVGIIGILVFICIAIYHACLGHFSPQDYGIGLASSVGGVGIGIGAKSHAEPKQ